MSKYGVAAVMLFLSVFLCGCNSVNSLSIENGDRYDGAGLIPIFDKSSGKYGFVGVNGKLVVKCR